jgi:hypothetical protein
MNQAEAAAAVVETNPAAFMCDGGGPLGFSVSVMFETLSEAQQFHRAIVTLFQTSK